MRTSVSNMKKIKKMYSAASKRGAHVFKAYNMRHKTYEGSLKARLVARSVRLQHKMYLKILEIIFEQHILKKHSVHTHTVLPDHLKSHNAMQ